GLPVFGCPELAVDRNAEGWFWGIGLGASQAQPFVEGCVLLVSLRCLMVILFTLLQVLAARLVCAQPVLSMGFTLHGVVSLNGCLRIDHLRDVTKMVLGACKARQRGVRGLTVGLPDPGQIRRQPGSRIGPYFDHGLFCDLGHIGAT